MFSKLSSVCLCSVELSLWVVPQVVYGECVCIGVIFFHSVRMFLLQISDFKKNKTKQNNIFSELQQESVSLSSADDINSLVGQVC